MSKVSKNQNTNRGSSDGIKFGSYHRYIEGKRKVLASYVVIGKEVVFFENRLEKAVAVRLAKEQVA